MPTLHCLTKRTPSFVLSIQRDNISSHNESARVWKPYTQWGFPESNSSPGQTNTGHQTNIQSRMLSRVHQLKLIFKLWAAYGLLATDSHLVKVRQTISSVTVMDKTWGGSVGDFQPILSCCLKHGLKVGTPIAYISYSKAILWLVLTLFSSFLLAAQKWKPVLS